jgi:elongation factor P
VQIEFFDGRSVGIFPPSSVVLEVKETQPTLKGATASASYKPATVETGLTIPVPLFVQVGDRIRVDTYDGKYLERVS